MAIAEERRSWQPAARILPPRVQTSNANDEHLPEEPFERGSCGHACALSSTAVAPHIGRVDLPRAWARRPRTCPPDRHCGRSTLLYWRGGEGEGKALPCRNDSGAGATPLNDVVPLIDPCPQLQPSRHLAVHSGATASGLWQSTSTAAAMGPVEGPPLVAPTTLRHKL